MNLIFQKKVCLWGNKIIPNKDKQFYETSEMKMQLEASSKYELKQTH